MENPFKPDDTVLTRIKGVEVEVTVKQVWNREVQVKTGEGTLLWRTMHTVWHPGFKPIPKAAETPSPVAPGPSLEGNRDSQPTPVPQATSDTNTVTEAAMEEKRRLAKKRRARRLNKKKGDAQ